MRKDDMNPIPHSAHPMCDCPTNHRKDCFFFFDEYIDEEEYRTGEMLPVVPYVGTGTNATSASTSTALSASTTDSDVWTWKSHSSCKHNMSPFVLPSGATVYASAWRDVPYNRTSPPDVGVYFDTSWFPAECFAYAVGWQDFGLPTIPDTHVIRTAQAVLNHVSYEERVEIGCLGAHGRTGTFLALLVILDSEQTAETYGYKRAISYVRDNHCPLAIEAHPQEQWIRRISGKLCRGDI